MLGLKSMDMFDKEVDRVFNGFTQYLSLMYPRGVTQQELVMLALAAQRLCAVLSCDVENEEIRIELATMLTTTTAPFIIASGKKQDGN